MTSLASPLPGPASHTGHIGYLSTRRFSARGIALTVAAHAGILAVLATADVLPIAPPLPTLIVDILKPEAPPAPPTELPKPKPATAKPVRPQARPTEAPVLAAPATASAATAEVAPVKEAPAPVAPPAPAAPAVLTQPRFDADYLANPAPTYPPLSRRMGEEGRVILRVFVEPSGRPSQIELRTSSGSSRLDQAAQDAVWRWQFVAARRGDETVGAWVLVPIVFNLKN